MLILVLRESKQNQVHISRETASNNASLWTCRWYYSTKLCIPKSFHSLCLFVFRISDVLHFQVTVEFFLIWESHFIKSLPRIHVQKFFGNIRQNLLTLCLLENAGSRIINRPEIPVKWLKTKLFCFDVERYRLNFSNQVVLFKFQNFPTFSMPRYTTRFWVFK